MKGPDETMPQRLYIITGANGHLASTIIRYLKAEDCVIRGLILPEERNEDDAHIRYYTGDITKPDSMQAIFSELDGYAVTVIHAAGLISIGSQITPALYEVNVNGTKNVIKQCKAHGVQRLLYISSVHAIAEGDRRHVIQEAGSFSKDAVVGAYARTKAEATQAVMDAAAAGLDTVVVHPSGIIGPFDAGRNHLTQLIRSYISGKLPAGVGGGYDFVDVRDVALGCIAAAKNGVSGECYILSNRYISMKDLFEYMRQAVNGRKKPCIPLKLAKLFAPAAEAFGKLTRTRPLFTRYSLYTLNFGGQFSHDKATAALGYRPRDIRDTIRDTILYLQTGACPPEQA